MDVFVLCVVVALLSLHVYAVISGACVARFVVEEGQEQAGKALARAAVALEVLKTALADEGGGGGEEPGGAAGEEEPQAAATPDGPADSDGSPDGTSSGSDSDDTPSSFGRQSEIGGDAEESSDTDDTDGQPGAPDLDLDQAERIMLALEDDDRDAEWDGDGAGIGGDAAQAGAFTIDQFLDQFFASQFWLPGVAAAACSPLLIGFCLLLVLLSHAIGFAVGDVAPASPARADLDALRNGTGIGHLACPAQGPMGVGNATAPGSDEWLSLAWKGDRDVRWVAKELWPGVWGSFGAVGITQALMLPVDETAGRALVGLLVVSGLLSAVFSACAVPCLLVRQLRSGLCGRPEALATAADLAVRRAAAKGASGAPVGDDLAQARLAATEAASSLARSSEGRIGQAARLASPASCGIEASFEAGACSCTGICNAVSLAVDPCARSCSGAVALYLVLPIAAGAVAACAAMAEGSALAGLAVAVSPAPLLPGVNGTLAWSSLEPLTAALSSALDLPSSPDVIVSPMADVVWGAWTSEWWLLATRLLLLGTGILAIAEDVASATTSVLVMPSCLTVALSPRAPPATSTSELGFNASTTCRTVIVDLFARFAWACLVTVALLGPSGAVLLDATPERAASVPAAAMAVAPSIATLSVQLPPTWCSPPAEQAGGHEPDGLNASSSHAIASCALSYSWRQAPLDDDVLGLAGLAASPLHFAATALGRGRPPLAFGWPGIDAAPGATVSGITLGANSSQPATSRQASPDPGRFLGTEPGRRLSATALSLSDSGALELPLGTWTWSVPVRGKEVKADPDRCGSARTGPCAPPPPSLQLSGLRKAPTRSASGLVVQSPAWAAFHRASAADVAVRDLHEGLSRDAVQALVDRCGATMVSSTPAGVPALELAVGTSAAAALSGAGSRCGAPAAATSADPGWDASPELVLSELLSLAGRQGTAAGKLAAQGGAGAAPGREGPNAAAIEALLDGSQGAFNASGAAREAGGDEAQEQERQELARVWLHAPAAAFPMPLSSWWPQTRRAVVKMAKSGASIVGAVPSSTDPATVYLVPEPSARPGSKLSAEATAAGVDWALGRASLPTDQGPASAVWQASLDGRPLEFVVGHDRKHERDADDMFSSDDSSSDSGSDSDSDGGDEPASSEAERAAADASKTRQELQTCRRLVRAAPGCASGGGEPSDRLARVLATWLRVASVAWEAVPLAATALLVADLALAVAVALVWAGMWAGACLWAESPHLEAMLPHGPVVAIVGLLAVCMFLEKFYLTVVTGATVVGSFLLLKGKALLSPLAAAVGWALTSCAVEEHFAMHVGALPMHRGTRTGATTERVLGWCAVTFVGLPALLMAMGSASLVLLNGFEAPYQASSIWAPPALVPTMPGASYYATISSPPPPTTSSSLGGHLAILISFMADAAAVLRVGSLHWGVAALAAGLIAMPILERLPGVARSLWMVMDLMTLHSWPSESKEYFKAVAGACLTSVVALGLTTLPSLFRRVSHYAMLVALGTGSSTWHLALPRWVLDGMARWLGASLEPFTGAATGHWAAAAAAGWADHGGVVFPWWPAPAVVESAAFAVVSALVVAECGCGSVSRLCCPRRERLRVRSRQPRA
ncbi:hypothetical protein FNF28_00478 [Cafeteria roenbergensis]|uniref:Uncharacterized protein n=2 Tax=Cafeteria roenbergensis TaxID=33653 RepID=A0A5A8E220_CAFRO|nr:hypothetical protein FNF28_00478 [Cafeteria roenbergensis]